MLISKKTYPFLKPDYVIYANMGETMELTWIFNTLLAVSFYSFQIHVSLSLSIVAVLFWGLSQAKYTVHNLCRARTEQGGLWRMIEAYSIVVFKWHLKTTVY